MAGRGRKEDIMNIDEALQGYENQSLRSKETQKAYKKGLNIFVQYLAEKKISLDDQLYKLQAEVFVNYPFWLGAAKYSKKSLGVYLSAVKSFMNYLTVMGLLDLTYSQNIRWSMAIKEIRSKRESRLPKYPKREDAQNLIDAVKTMKDWPILKKRNIALILILASTGCRNDEISKLKVGNISYNDNSLTVIGKGDKERRVYFSPEAGIALKAYLDLRAVEDDQPVFLRHDKANARRIVGISTNAIRSVVKKVCKAAGVKGFTVHSFRKSFATLMLSKTHDLALVQDLLGHVNPETTRIYAQISGDAMKAGYQSVFGGG
jgi:integrase/recombinase XerD